MVGLDVNIEGVEEIVVQEVEIVDDGYDENKDGDIEEIDYDENVDIEEFEN